jgi:type IV pilus assembly protein PilC
VEGGQQLSESMARHPKVFSALYTNLVAAGEAGGILDTILNRLAIYLEKAAKLARQVRGALVYPISVLVVAILVLIVLLWKVIPIFERMFADFGGAKLPVPTQVVIALSNGFIKFAPLIVGGLIGIFVGTTALLRWEPSRRVFDRVLLKVPIFGPVIRKVAVARFTRTLGTLMASGVPILDALGICAKVAGNYTVEDALLYSREKISEGRSIVEPLGETKVFPPMVIQMIGVGEATGAMDTMLGKIADFYEEEVDVAVAALTRLIEPAMFVFLGGVVGGLMVAMYLPVFELAGAIKTE